MKILIAGDSWGCGEWEDSTGFLRNIHPGLESFLKHDGHTVTNVSKGGADLDGIARQLINVNRKNKKSAKYDLVLVFVTNSFRQLGKKDFWNRKKTYKDYLEIHNSNLTNFVKIIDQSNVGPIYLLGGLSKVDKQHVKDTNIKIAIPSILELIIPELTQYDMFFYEHMQLLTQKNINKPMLERVYEQDLIWQKYRDHILLQPDKAHPNRIAHYKIYEHLKNEVLNYNIKCVSSNGKKSSILSNRVNKIT